LGFKVSYIFLFFFWSFLLNAQNTRNEITWQGNFEHAKHLAKRKKMPILLYFTGSDWCAPCIRMEKEFWKSKDVLQFCEDFVFVKVDCPRRTDLLTDNQRTENLTLLREFNKSKIFPCVIILTKNHRIWEKMSGYSGESSQKNYLLFLKRFSKNR